LFLLFYTVRDRAVQRFDTRPTFGVQYGGLKRPPALSGAKISIARMEFRETPEQTNSSRPGGFVELAFDRRGNRDLACALLSNQHQPPRSDSPSPREAPPPDPLPLLSPAARRAPPSLVILRTSSRPHMHDPPAQTLPASPPTPTTHTPRLPPRPGAAYSSHPTQQATQPHSSPVSSEAGRNVPNQPPNNTVRNLPAHTPRPSLSDHPLHNITTPPLSPAAYATHDSRLLTGGNPQLHPLRTPPDSL